MSQKDEFKISLQNKALLHCLEAIRSKMDETLAETVSEVVDLGERKVKEKAPKRGQKPWTTGELYESIKTRLAPLQGEIYTEKFYAWFVETKTRPHWIGYPVLIGGVGWRWIGQHPGTQPQPMFKPTLNELRREAPDIMKKNVVELISHFTRGI